MNILVVKINNLSILINFKNSPCIINIIDSNLRQFYIL